MLVGPTKHELRIKILAAKAAQSKKKRETLLNEKR